MGEDRLNSYLYDISVMTQNEAVKKIINIICDINEEINYSDYNDYIEYIESEDYEEEVMEYVHELEEIVKGE